jgi:TP901 family phage tail tape measure protein
MAIDKIIVEFQAETTKLKKELDALKGRLGAVETDAKKAKDKIDDVGKGANGLKGTLQDLGKTIAAAFAVQQLVSFGREAVNAAAAFDKSMSNVATLVDTNVESMDSMAASVRDLAKKTPVELGQLSSALYDVRSAGVSAEDAMAVLESSAQLGVAGLATTAEAANIMTSAVNAFAAEGLSAEQISDILFKTVKAGKTTLAELTAQFGGVAPAAAAAGVSLADLQASTAAITTLGTPAAAAQTQLKQALTEMQKPGKELSNIFQKLGAKDGIDLIKTSGGLGNAFKLIKEKAEELGMTVAQVTGSVETSSAILALGGTVNESYAATLADMTTGANAVNVAFEKQAQTADAQFQLMQNAFEDVKITIGNALMPALLGAAEGLRDFLDGVDADTIKNLGKLLFIVASGFGAMKVAALAKDMGGLTGILKSVTGGVQGLNTAIRTNPFGLIASSVAALIAYGPDLIEMFSGVTEFQKEIAKVSSEAGENLRKEQAELNLVADALARTNPQSQERARLLQRFNELSPIAIEDLKDECEFNDQLKTALNGANSSFQQRIRLRAAEAVAQTASQKQIEAEAKAIGQSTKILMQNGNVNQKILNQFRKEIEAGNVSLGYFNNIPETFKKIGLEMGYSAVEANKLFRQASDNSGLFEEYAESISLSAEAGKELNNIETMLAKSEIDAKTKTKSKEEARYMALLAEKVYLNKKLTKDEEKELGLLEKKIKLGQQLSTEEEASLSKLTAPTKTTTAATTKSTKAEDDAEKLIEINAKFNEETMSLADELTLMMIADEDKRGQKLLEIQKKKELASIEASKYNEDQKGILKAQLDAKYNQLEITRQEAQKEKLNKVEEEANQKREEELEAFYNEAAFTNKDRLKQQLADEEAMYAELLAANKLKEEQKFAIEERFAKMRKEIEGTQGNQATQLQLDNIEKVETKMGEVFGAVNSVLGPAMDALNGYFDLQLNNLEKEKNERLANENLTAEERLRIEEEYEAKKNAILAEQFEVSRGSQIIQAIMSSAQAALNAFTSTALLFAPAAPAAAAAAAAFGAVQIGIIAAQPNPYKFFEGTDYLQLGGNPKGKDTIPVMAHEGEAIIPTGKNLQYPGLAKSWIDGSLDGYINKNFVRPALMEQQRQAEEDFADRLAASMALQMSSNFDDYRLHRDMKEQTAVLRDGFQTMKQTRKKLRGA